MSSTNKTTNYELTQFLATDVPSWLVDYNGDMTKIDTQMHANAVAAGAASAAANTAGNKADAAVADVAALEAVLDTPTTGVLARMASAENDIDTIQSLIGNGEPTTSDKTIIGAINELYEDITGGGTAIEAKNVSYDNTDSGLTADDVQEAIDELVNMIPAPIDAGFIEFKRQFSNKKIVVIGDSLSIDNTTWVKSLKDLCDTCGSTVTNISVAGRSSVTMLPDVQALETAYDVAILWIGTNDAASGSPTPIGGLGTAGSYIKNMYDMLDALITLNDDMKIFVLGLPYSTNMTLNKDKSFYDYSFAAKQVANYCGAVFKNMGHLVCSGPHNHSAQPVDGLHFSEVFSKTELFTTIVNKMLVPSSDEVHEVIKLKPQDLTFSGGVSVTYFTGYYVVGSHVHIETTLLFANGVAASTDFITFPAPIKSVDDLTFIMFSGQNMRSCFVHGNGVKPVSNAIGANESWRFTLDFPVTTGMLEQYANA